MYRVFAIVLNIILGLFADTFFQQEVTLNVDTPTQVVAGTEFEVRVNIHKGDLESFSRLQQSLPAGLTASASNSSNADFTFEDKRVRLIWLRMPRQDEFSVTYLVKVDQRLKGTFDIKGKFSYIDNNERKSVSFESSQITIQPSPDIDPSLVVDINDFEKTVIPYIAPASASPEIACIRQQPYPDQNGSGYIVNLLVNKESKDKFAKIEEKIPAGYDAISIDPKESIFTFKGGTAKFLWMNMPASPYFIVSYKLVPTGQNSAPPQPKGKFSYLETDKTISIDIKQTGSDLATLTPTEVGDLIASLSNQPAGKTGITPETAKVEKAQPEETKLIASNNTPAKKETKETRKTKKSHEVKGNSAYQLEPESGVYFRVQLAAGHDPVNIERYFRKYKLDREVRKEKHEGWIKYSVGSFPVYKEARDYRVHIWNTTVIGDAFVSAYNNGDRITVQEALMIANQQWYK